MHELSASSLSDFFKILCQESGVRFEIDSKVSTAQIDTSGTVHVPVIDHLNADSILSSSFQQAGFMHKDLKFARDVHSRLANPSNPLQMAVVDTLFSHLSERNMHGEYKGRDSLLLDKRMKETPLSLETLPPQLQVLKSLDLKSRRKWQSPLLPEPKLSSHAKFIESALDVDLDEELKEILETKDASRLERLVKEIVKDIEENPSGGGGDGDSGTDSNKDSKGQDDGSKEGEGEGEGESQSGGNDKETEGSGGGNDKSPKDSPVSGDENSKSGGQDQKPGEQIGGRGASQPNPNLPKLDASSCKREFKQEPKLEYDKSGYTPCSSPPKFEEKRGLSDISSGDKASITKLVESSFVSKRIQRHLKVMSTSLYEGGKTRGRINQRSLHKFYAHQGESIPKVFKTKTLSHLNNDTAVVLLQDCSGSMGGKKYLMASACCCLISETLRDLRIAHELYGFTDDDRIHIYEYKKAGEKNISRDSMISRFSERRMMGNNNDGDSILLVAEKLSSLPQKNKVLIVLSDGAPASTSMRGNPGERLKVVNKFIEEETPIHLIGVGILDSNVTHYYKHHTVVKNISELDDKLLTIIKQAVVR